MPFLAGSDAKLSKTAYADSKSDVVCNSTIASDLTKPHCVATAAAAYASNIIASTTSSSIIICVATSVTDSIATGSLSASSPVNGYSAHTSNVRTAITSSASAYIAIVAYPTSIDAVVKTNAVLLAANDTSSTASCSPSSATVERVLITDGYATSCAVRIENQRADRVAQGD